MRGAVTAVVAVALAGGGIAVGLAGPAAAGAADASAAERAVTAQRSFVAVRDNFFSPGRLGVRRGTTVVWRWAPQNTQTHNVVLRRAPRGVKRFRSRAATTGYRFRRKLRRAGRYRLVCTFHAGMAMRIRVRR